MTALRLVVGCSGRNPVQFGLHFERIVGEHPVSGAMYFGVQIQSSARWMSRAFTRYIREAGEGAVVASADLAQIQCILEVRLA